MPLTLNYCPSTACSASPNYCVAAQYHGKTRRQPKREIGIVDGLLSVTQRAWRVELRASERNDGSKRGQ